MKLRSSALLLMLASSSALADHPSIQFQIYPVGMDPAAHVTITPVEAKAYLGATNADRIGCGSTSVGFGDFFQPMSSRRANGKDAKATVTQDGDHFVVTVDMKDEGGRCGYQLTEVDAKVRVKANATAAGPALDSELYWDLTYNQGTPYPKVTCARPIQKTFTTNVGDIPPGGTILSTETRDDGTVAYTYQAMLPNLWCNTNNQRGSTNGRAEVPVSGNSQIQLRIDLTPGAVPGPT